jgi:hypothetical protein
MAAPGWLVGPDSLWFWQALQAIAVTVSLLMIWRQLRLQRYKNMLDVLTYLDQTWSEERLVFARLIVCRAYTEKKGLHDINFRQEPLYSFFENIGLLVRKRVLDPDVIWESYSQPIEYYWCMLETSVHNFRAAGHDNTWYTGFEYLYHKCAKISLKNSAENPRKSDDVLQKYASTELKRLRKEPAPAQEDHPTSAKPKTAK